MWRGAVGRRAPSRWPWASATNRWPPSSSRRAMHSGAHGTPTRPCPPITALCSNPSPPRRTANRTPSAAGAEGERDTERLVADFLLDHLRQQGLDFATPFDADEALRRQGAAPR